MQYLLLFNLTNNNKKLILYDTNYKNIVKDKISKMVSSDFINNILECESKMVNFNNFEVKLFNINIDFSLEEFESFLNGKIDEKYLRIYNYFGKKKQLAKIMDSLIDKKNALDILNTDAPSYNSILNYIEYENKLLEKAIVFDNETFSLVFNSNKYKKMLTTLDIKQLEIDLNNYPSVFGIYVTIDGTTSKICNSQSFAKKHKNRIKFCIPNKFIVIVDVPENNKVNRVTIISKNNFKNYVLYTSNKNSASLVYTYMQKSPLASYNCVTLNTSRFLVDESGFKSNIEIVSIIN